MSQSEAKKHITVLVTELFPRLCKQRILLVNKEVSPSVKSTDGKQYISIPYNLFEQYLLLGQQYYIERREWENLTNFTNMMLDCCGYTKLSQIRFQSHVNKFHYIQENRSHLRIDSSAENHKELAVTIAFMCEFKAVAAEFIQFCNEYYRAVCMLDTNDEKSCLIPICAIKPASLFTDTTTAIQPEDYRSSVEDQDESFRMNLNKKRERTSFVDSQQHKRQKIIEMPDRGGEGLNSYCMGGVDNALQILSKAADCMRHSVELWDWAFNTAPNGPWSQMYTGWEEGKIYNLNTTPKYSQSKCLEIIRVIESYQLPFDLTNAVLLVRSDLALSSVRIQYINELFLIA
jgi:hypothetical protein